MHPELLVRKRMMLLTVVLLTLFAMAVARVGQLTTIRSAELTRRGISQWTKAGTVTARRGKMVDRNGNVLVVSATSYIVCADPRAVSDEALFLDTLVPVLSLDRETALKKLRAKTKGQVILKRQVPRETVDQLRTLKQEAAEETGLKALTFEEDASRWYPYGEMLSQVLGLTNVDSAGQSGLEKQYDAALAGVAGKYLHQVDARNRTLADSESYYTASSPGATLKLTIDATIQEICEKAMRECLEVNQAESVLCLVSDVRTGAILAMCMRPDYDPNDPPRSNVEELTSLMRITAISDVYEPGSTFKILTASAALDSGVTTPEDRFYCSAKIAVDGDTIRCWGRAHGPESMAEGLQNSCNPVFVELALRMGTDIFYRYLTSFGLGKSTGLDLPGESEGILIGSRYVKNVDLARIGFGQSVAVTPLQLMMAANACINGGKLMKPYLVSEIQSAEGEVLQRATPMVRATPIRAETSDTMRELLEAVVKQGGGKNAAVPGYRIGGKTGTAQVYKEGKIVRNVHIGSFYGFAPVEDPQFSVMVVVKEAQTPVDYGSTTAAPFAGQIMASVLQYLEVPPAEEGVEYAEVTVPDITGLTISAARRTLAQAGLELITDETAETVQSQLPPAGASLVVGGHVMAYTAGTQAATPMELICVPDFTGMCDVDITRVARLRDLDVSLTGTGYCVRQTPGAGEYVPHGAAVEAVLEPLNPPAE